jgi:hydroxymethylbilane synthase
MAEPRLRLGTRGSALALAQADYAAKLLGGAEIVPIKTSGDSTHEAGRADGRPRIDDKARFVREIERALLAGEVDIGVHSAKDLPSELPEGLEIAGVPPREDPRDAYIGRVNSLGACPPGARIGTSSLRRRSQLLARRSDLEVIELRGNVDTRLARYEAGDFDGLLLACAGLQRLGRAEEISFHLEPDEITPAPGQGTLVLEAAHSNDRAVVAAESITDRDTLATLLAERALVASLDATCNTPLGALATIHKGGRITIQAYCGLPDGSEWLRDEHEQDDADPEGAGRVLADRMKSAGAEDLLRRAEQMDMRGHSVDPRARDGAPRDRSEERPVS